MLVCLIKTILGEKEKASVGKWMNTWNPWGQEDLGKMKGFHIVSFMVRDSAKTKKHGKIRLYEPYL